MTDTEELTILRLPAELTDELDLADVNQKLHEGSVKLDWSGVSTAPSKHLETLLDGLDKVKNAGALGLKDDSISDDTASAIETYFRNRKPLTEPTVLVKPSNYQIRRELEEIVIKDLLGPAQGEEEEVDEPKASDRYLVGLVAPRNKQQEPEVLDDDLPGGEDDGGGIERNIPVKKALLPSSVGLTCCFAPDATAFKICASYGKYERKKSETLLTEKGEPKLVWKRVPIEKTIDRIELKDKLSSKYLVHNDETHGDVFVRVEVRREKPKDGKPAEWYVSAFLVNNQTEPAKLRDAAWIFQPEIVIESATENEPICIKKMRLSQSKVIDPRIAAEKMEMAMLYRHRVEFGKGHGIGVHAEVSENDPKLAVRIRTKVIPSHEVSRAIQPKVSDNPLLEHIVLDMKELAETATADFGKKLSPLIDAYDNWLETKQKPRIESEPDLSEFKVEAGKNLDKCREALKRIREGLELIQSDENAAEAFRFMNRAMWQQRLHTILSEKKRRGEEMESDDAELAKIDADPNNHKWYSFQIAFILLSLPAVANVHHPDRSPSHKAIADLLWFPTGGGKTEAYLGLTAFTLAIRRLQGNLGGRDGENGVAVLMRYTLRLLTLQQFQRAAALICACEVIRRGDETKWKKEPFRIGLWVGSKTTPNKTERSADFRNRASSGQPGSVSSPLQLTSCPWCGVEVGINNLTVDVKGWRRTFLYCGDPLGICPFTRAQSEAEGIPVLVVDEELYRLLPSLLISTVDKFADMPWRGETEMLFGQVDSRCSRHGFRSPEIDDANAHNSVNGLPAAKTQPHSLLRPPDLIIQDELHLISGPLGTMVGLYETAIDSLCTWEVNGKAVRPKVIASTATIKQAQDQIHKLFLREARVFPPNGLDVRDNFFSIQEEPDEKNFGRLYLGICAPGRRLKAALIRVYVALLGGAQELFTKYGQDADAYMSLVGYFSSLRELGSMRRAVEDDVKLMLRRAQRRGLRNRELMNIEELTSRKSATDIPVVLDRLEVPFEVLVEDSASKKERQKRKAPVDVLLATNMISVGVDVKRLGSMVVAGQPKATAEYIQATSRVGRSYPGIVVTVFNWSRPRDLSHYEGFEYYHQTFYNQVESLSLTPFSAGAMQRGLSALLVAMARLGGMELNPNSSAEKVTINHPFIKKALDEIIRRAELVEGVSKRDEVERELKSRVDDWLQQINVLHGGARLGYKTANDGLTVGLLKEANLGGWEKFTCLRSLRNVEPSVNLIMPEYRFIDDEPGRVPHKFDENGEDAD